MIYIYLQVISMFILVITIWVNNTELVTVQTNDNLLRLIYHEAKENIVDARYPLTLDKCDVMATIQANINHGPYQDGKHSPEFFKLVPALRTYLVQCIEVIVSRSLCRGQGHLVYNLYRGNYVEIKVTLSIITIGGDSLLSLISFHYRFCEFVIIMQTQTNISSIYISIINCLHNKDKTYTYEYFGKFVFDDNSLGIPI